MPPQDSPLAFSSSTPSTIACGLHRELRGGLHEAALERGRGGHDLERRPGRLRGGEGDAGERADLARCAGRAPRRRRAGRRARSPRPPGGACRSWSRAVARRAAWRAPARALRRRSSPPGRPRRRCSNDLLEPGLPHRPVLAGSRARRGRAAPRRSPGAPSARRSSRRCPRAARCATVAGPSREHLAVAATGCVARLGGRLARVSRSPGPQLGEHEPRATRPPARRTPGSAWRRGERRTRAS